jgi:hypothetical protein
MVVFCRSSLIESESVAESLRHSTTPRYTPFTPSAHYSSPFGGATVDVNLDGDSHVQQIIEEAKQDVMKLKSLKDR